MRFIQHLILTGSALMCLGLNGFAQEAQEPAQPQVVPEGGPNGQAAPVQVLPVTGAVEAPTQPTGR